MSLTGHLSTLTILILASKCNFIYDENGEVVHIYGIGILVFFNLVHGHEKPSSFDFLFQGGNESVAPGSR